MLIHGHVRVFQVPDWVTGGQGLLRCYYRCLIGCCRGAGVLVQRGLEGVVTVQPCCMRMNNNASFPIRLGD